MEVNNMNRNSLSFILLSLSSMALAAPRPPRPTEAFVPSQRSTTSSGMASTRPRSAGLHSRRQPQSMPPNLISLPENVRPNNASPGSTSRSQGRNKRTAAEAFPSAGSSTFARRGDGMSFSGPSQGIKRARTWGGEASRRLHQPIPSLPPPAAWQRQQNRQLPPPPVSWRHHQLPQQPGTWQPSQQYAPPTTPGTTTGSWDRHQSSISQPPPQNQLQLPQVLPPPSWRLSPQQQQYNIQQNHLPPTSQPDHEPLVQHTEAWQNFNPGPLSAPVPDWGTVEQQTMQQWQQQLVLPLPQQRPRSTPVTFSSLHDPSSGFPATLATLPSPPIVPSMPTSTQLNEMGQGSVTALTSPARSA